MLGKWVLNATKSTTPPRDSTITIEATGSRFKITLNFTDDHGMEFSSWTVTDMKGDWSSVRRSFAKSSEKWRVTRDGRDAFLLETVFSTNRYEVSSDGGTLTDQTIHSNLPLHARFPDSVRAIKTNRPLLVYDRSDK